MVRLSILVCALFALACDSGESQDPNAIGRRGGVLAIANGAAVVIPANALSDTIVVTIAPTGAGDGLPAGIIAVGPAITFGPEGQEFALPVTVTVPATRRATGIHRRPAAGGGWTKLEGASYDAAAGLVSAQTTRFSELVATIGVEE